MGEKRKWKSCPFDLELAAEGLLELEVLEGPLCVITEQDPPSKRLKPVIEFHQEDDAGTDAPLSAGGEDEDLESAEEETSEGDVEEQVEDNEEAEEGIEATEASSEDWNMDAEDESGDESALRDGLEALDSKNSGLVDADEFWATFEQKQKDAKDATEKRKADRRAKRQAKEAEAMAATEEVATQELTAAMEQDEEEAAILRVPVFEEVTPDSLDQTVVNNWATWDVSKLHDLNEAEKGKLRSLAFGVGLHPIILKNIAVMGWTSPVAVQIRTCLPAIVKRHHMVIASETGSGKTGAFAIPILHQLFLNPSQLTQLRALALVPSHELAQQVHSVFKSLAAGSNMRTACLVGGISVQKQTRLLTRRPPLVVGTIGRISAFTWGEAETSISAHVHLSDFSSLRYMVLDEADRLLEWGKVKEVRRFFDKLRTDCIKGEVTSKCQFYVSSATLMMNEAERKGKGPLSFIPLEPSKTTVVNLTEAGPQAPSASINQSTSKLKLPSGLRLHSVAVDGDTVARDSSLLATILLMIRKAETQAKPFKVIVFVNSIDYVQRLFNLFSILMGDNSPIQEKVRLVSLHSRKGQKQRYEVVEKFEASLVSCVMLATDVAARGLDIPAVNYIIHLEPPTTAPLFVHRCGRTARGASATGDSILFLGPEDNKKYIQVFTALGRKVSEVVPWARVSDRRAQPMITAIVRQAATLERSQHQAKKKLKNANWEKAMCDAADLPYPSDHEDTATEGSDQEAEGVKKNGPSPKMIDGSRAAVLDKLSKLWRLLDKDEKKTTE